jgi:hypothetical protein
MSKRKQIYVANFNQKPIENKAFLLHYLHKKNSIENLLQFLIHKMTAISFEFIFID